jgi:hypothetical protein
MRPAWLSLGWTLAITPLAAQATVRLAAGATMSTSLIQDGSLFSRLTPTVAPDVSLAVSYPTGPGYRVVLEADLRHAGLDAVDNDPREPDYQFKDRIGSLTTVDALLLVEGQVFGPLRWQAGGGVVFYRPGEREGVFQDGGTHRWVIAGGLAWTHPMGPRWNALVQGRVDHQGFTTPTLVDRGYGESQSVQRLSLQLGVERRL